MKTEIMAKEKRIKKKNFNVTVKEEEKLSRLAHEHYMTISEFIRFKTLGKK